MAIGFTTIKVSCHSSTGNKQLPPCFLATTSCVDTPDSTTCCTDVGNCRLESGSCGCLSPACSCLFAMVLQSYRWGSSLSSVTSSMTLCCAERMQPAACIRATSSCNDAKLKVCRTARKCVAQHAPKNKHLQSICKVLVCKTPSGYSSRPRVAHKKKSLNQ